MRFFPIDTSINNQVDELLKMLFLLKNGETADMLARMGLQYRVSYGASLVHIRQMGNKVQKNNEVALRLWYREIRESMILATLLVDVEQMPEHELNSWAQLISNAELAEQCALNLFSKTAELPSLANTFIQSSNNFVVATAYFSVGWAIKSSLFNDSVKHEMSKLLVSKCDFKHIFVSRAFSHLMRQWVRYSAEGVELASKWLQENSDSSNAFLQVARAEILNEIEFVNTRGF